MSSLIHYLRGLVENDCKKDANVFGYQIWSHHIVQVVNFSITLAKELSADEEVVTIAALLHDYASIIDERLYKEHHIHGMTLADQILSNAGYDPNKKEIVKQCIFTHRGSFFCERFLPEQQCIASADAMAHIDQSHSLMYLAFCKKGMSIEQGCEWVNRKIDRSWHKLCREAKFAISILQQNNTSDWTIQIMYLNSLTYSKLLGGLYGKLL